MSIVQSAGSSDVQQNPFYQKLENCLYFGKAVGSNNCVFCHMTYHMTSITCNDITLHPNTYKHIILDTPTVYVLVDTPTVYVLVWFRDLILACQSRVV